MRCAQTLLVIGLAGVIVIAASRLTVVVIPVLIALILACALYPLVALLRRYVPHAVAALIALLLGAAAVGGTFALAIVPIQAEWPTLQTEAAKGLSQAMEYLHRGPLPISDSQISNAIDAAKDFATSSAFGHDAVAGAVTTLEVGTGFLLCLFVLFYLLKDGPSIRAFLLRPFHARLHAQLLRAGGRAATVLGSYLRGTAIVALVDTVFIGTGLGLLGVPLALPLATLVFLTAFVPVVGATASGIIAALVALVTVGLDTAVWVSLIVLAVNQLEAHLLSPLVLGKSLHLHPLAVLLTLAAGAIVGGIAGALLAVPLVGVAWAVGRSWDEPLCK